MVLMLYFILICHGFESHSLCAFRLECGRVALARSRHAGMQPSSSVGLGRDCALPPICGWSRLASCGGNSSCEVSSVMDSTSLLDTHGKNSNWPQNAQKTQKTTNLKLMEQPQFCESCASCGFLLAKGQFDTSLGKGLCPHA